MATRREIGSGNEVDRVMVSQATREMTYMPGSTGARQRELEREYAEWTKQCVDIQAQLSLLNGAKTPRRAELIRLLHDAVKEKQRIKPVLMAMNRETNIGERELLDGILHELKKTNSRLDRLIEIVEQQHVPRSAET